MPQATIDANTPPSALANSFELALAGLCAQAGVSLVLHHGHLKLSPTDTVQPVLVWGWAGALILGALLMVLGLLWRGHGDTSRSIEKAGLVLQLSVWVSFMGTLLWLSPGVATLPNVAQAAVVIFGCVGRFIALVKTDRAMQRIHAMLQDSDGA